MAIHELDGGIFVISSNSVWLPGAYADKRSARLAFRLPHQELQRLQDMANDRAGGAGGILTYEDIARAVKELRGVI